VREVLVRKFRNANMAPSRHASYLRLRCLKATWPVEAVLAELEALTPPALQARRRLRRDEFCVGSQPHSLTLVLAELDALTPPALQAHRRPRRDGYGRDRVSTTLVC
jgi:hypothetical protein